MDRELLLELGVEELPASWLPGLTAQLAATVGATLTARGLKFNGTVETFSTPRRLTAVVGELTDRQDDRDETVTGPPVSAAFTPDGHPTPAALGFARKQNVEFDTLVQTDTPRGRYLVCHKKLRGHATVDVLPQVLTDVLRGLAFPKQMHWDAQLEDGKGELLFGRPIRWLLYLYGGRVVPFTIARLAGASSPRVQDVTSGAVTYGHRFLATSGRAGRAIKVRSFDEYKKKLAEQFVLLPRRERRERIMRELDAHARRLGGRVLLHQYAQAEALIEEVPDLVEYPAVVAGAFAAEFLALPDEVLVTTLIRHQHFFPVVSATDALMPAFLAVTNTQSMTDRAIATNAERVVAARLRDARFFWEADRRTPLESRLVRLETLLFHHALGSYRQKVDRLETLARGLATGAFGQDEAVADHTARAARLAKADLATEMVRELTELQGTMGGIYAREEGEPEAVWKAVYYHYLPTAVEAGAPPRADQLGAGRVPWACVSLADKLDTLVGLFLAGERPTGSRDPFGLRRAAHGILRVLVDAETLAGVDVRAPLSELVAQARAQYRLEPDAAAQAALEAFLRERLESVFEQRGARPEDVRAVVRARPFAELRVADLSRNLLDLPAIAGTETFRQLAEAFKRVRNIAREWPGGAPPDLADLKRVLKEPAELALADELARRRATIEAAVGAGRGFREAYAEAAAFQPAVARFFAEVFVMVDDAALRQARLGLMKQLEQLILQLGDISEVVASEA